MSMKNPLTLAGIEPATFRFVAQHLNHRATAVPKLGICIKLKYMTTLIRVAFIWNFISCGKFFMKRSETISVHPAW